MRRIISVMLFIVLGWLNLYSQDTSVAKNKKPLPYVQRFGGYIVTMENNKFVSVVKDPNFDWSKALQRDTSFYSRWDNGIVEIYKYNSDKPIIKKYFVYYENDIVTEWVLSKEARLAKYHSKKGVLVVHLKEEVIPVNGRQLLDQFKISKKDVGIPLYINYRTIANLDELFACPDAVLRIDTIKDGDGIRFLNIVTKEWDDERKKHAGQDIIYIR